MSCPETVAITHTRVYRVQSQTMHAFGSLCGLSVLVPHHHYPDPTPPDNTRRGLADSQVSPVPLLPNAVQVCYYHPAPFWQHPFQVEAPVTGQLRDATSHLYALPAIHPLLQSANTGRTRNIYAFFLLTQVPAVKRHCGRPWIEHWLTQMKILQEVNRPQYSHFLGQTLIRISPALRREPHGRATRRFCFRHSHCSHPNLQLTTRERLVEISRWCHNPPHPHHSRD